MSWPTLLGSNSPIPNDVLISLPSCRPPYCCLSKPYSSALSWLCCIGASAHCGRKVHRTPVQSTRPTSRIVCLCQHTAWNKSQVSKLKSLSRSSEILRTIWCLPMTELTFLIWHLLLLPGSLISNESLFLWADFCLVLLYVNMLLSTVIVLCAFHDSFGQSGAIKGLEQPVRRCWGQCFSLCHFLFQSGWIVWVPHAVAVVATMTAAVLYARTWVWDTHTHTMILVQTCTHTYIWSDFCTLNLLNALPPDLFSCLLMFRCFKKESPLVEYLYSFTDIF